MRGVIVQFTQQVPLFLVKGRRGMHEKNRFTLPPAETLKLAVGEDMYVNTLVYCALMKVRLFSYNNITICQTIVMHVTWLACFYASEDIFSYIRMVRH